MGHMHRKEKVGWLLALGHGLAYSEVLGGYQLRLTVMAKKTKKKSAKIVRSAKTKKKVKTTAKKYRHGKHPNSIAAMQKHAPKKGEPSRNPSGRPKGRSLTVMLRQAVDEQLPSGQSVGEAMIVMATKMARAGQFNFFNEIFNRLDGKVPDRVLNEMTQRFVADEVSNFSALIVGVVLDLAADFIEGDQLEEFAGQLQDRVASLPAEAESEEDQEQVI